MTRYIAYHKAKLKQLLIIPLSLLLLSLQGCFFSTALPVVASGVGTGATLPMFRNTERTETHPVKLVFRSSVEVLKVMGFTIASTQPTERGWLLRANAPQRQVEMVLERITARATKVSVNVHNGSIVRDNATAEEIVRQLTRGIEHEVRLAENRRKAQLFVSANATDPTVKILNIVPKFRQGIALEAGRYELEVSASGYARETLWVELQPNEERFLELSLSKAE